MKTEDRDVQSNFIYTGGEEEEERGAGRLQASHLSAGCAGRALLSCPTGWTACRGDRGQEV